MLDAEIAAILLNRRGPDDPAATELLREGNLHFVAESGGLAAVDAATPGGAPMTVECLLFADGSRVFRVGMPGAQRGWSRWAVLEPFEPAPGHAPDAAHSQNPAHARGPQWA